MAFLDDDKKAKLNKFTAFAIKTLKIEHPPKVLIQNGKFSLVTTANYDYTDEQKVIKVNGKNRATVDIMRSIAHELVHHKQFEKGQLKEKPADIASNEENEANSKAGALIKMFALKDSTIYDE